MTLNTNGDVPASRLAAAVEMSHDRNVNLTIFESAGRGLIWPDRPGPTKFAARRRQRDSTEARIATPEL